MNVLPSLFSRIYAFLLRGPSDHTSATRGRGILSETRDIRIRSQIKVGSAIKLVIQQAAERRLHVSVRNSRSACDRALLPMFRPCVVN